MSSTHQYLHEYFSSKVLVSKKTSDVESRGPVYVKASCVNENLGLCAPQTCQGQTIAHAPFHSSDIYQKRSVISPYQRANINAVSIGKVIRCVTVSRYRVILYEIVCFVMDDLGRTSAIEDVRKKCTTCSSRFISMERFVCEGVYTAAVICEREPVWLSALPQSRI